MDQHKEPYVPPQLTIYGDVVALTQGPQKPSTQDNPTGGNGNTNIGCKPGGLCS